MIHKKRNNYVYIIAFGIATFLLACAIFSPFIFRTSESLQVAFLKVGQGDAIFITTPDNYQILIDAGRGSAVLQELGEYMEILDRTINLVVATHGDADHIGGLTYVFDAFDVDTVIHNGIPSSTYTYNNFIEGIQNNGAKEIIMTHSQEWVLSDDTRIRFLYPYDENVQAQDINNSSIIVQVVYKDTEILLTGDAGKEVEQLLIDRYHSDLESTILKAGHHGSRTSTKKEFLDVVSPEHIVLSYGNNSYGHPHKTVLDTIEEFFNSHSGNRYLHHTLDSSVVFEITRDGSVISF